jgi:hypothetical protein
VRYSVVDTDDPTLPGSPASGTRWDLLARLFANLIPEERAALLRLGDAWFRCGPERRALLEALAETLAD